MNDQDYRERNEANYKRFRTRIHNDVDRLLRDLNKGLKDEFDNINYKDMIIICNLLSERLANLDTLETLHERTLHTPSTKWLNKVIFDD